MLPFDQNFIMRSILLLLIISCVKATSQYLQYKGNSTFQDTLYINFDQYYSFNDLISLSYSFNVTNNYHNIFVVEITYASDGILCVNHCFKYYDFTQFYPNILELWGIHIISKDLTTVDYNVELIYNKNIANNYSYSLKFNYILTSIMLISLLNIVF